MAVSGLRGPITYPPVCPAPPVLVCKRFVGQPPGYDYSGDECSIDGELRQHLELPAPHPLLPGCDDSNITETEFHEEECGGAGSLDLVLWVIISLYMFYGMALVCEEFMVPALNVCCDEFSIPGHVSGATLLAAGCNAPELISSAISIFINRSTVGAGTVIGSAPFNILCITGVAALAVGGISLDAWLLAREAVSLLLALGLFVGVMADNLVTQVEAAALVALYVLYVLVVVKWDALLRVVRPLPTLADEKDAHTDYVDADSVCGPPIGRRLLVPSLPLEDLTAWREGVDAARKRSQARQSAAHMRTGAQVLVGEPSAAALIAHTSCRMHGTLLKKSRYYKHASRVGHRLWRSRYFVLDDSVLSPTRLVVFKPLSCASCPLISTACYYQRPSARQHQRSRRNLTAASEPPN